MRPFRPLAAAAAVVLSIALAGPAQAAVINGSFENASVNPGGGFITLGPGSTAINGWTVTSGTIDYIGGYWQAGDGNRSLDLSGGGAGTIAQQNITGLTVGESYTLTFLMAGNIDGGDLIKDVRVGIGGVTQDFQFDRTGFSHTNMGWSQRSLTFTATSSTTTLSFQSLEANPFGPAIDNVALDVAVPVPATLPLMLIGVGGLAAFARRRKTVQPA